MKFRTKLYGVFGLILVVLTIFLVILIKMVNQQTVNMNEVVSDLAERKKLTSTIQNEIGNMGRELSEISSLPTEDVLAQAINDWEQSRVTIDSSIDTLKKLDKRKETQELIAKFNTLYKTYEDTGEHIIITQKNEPNLKFDQALWKDVKDHRVRLQQITDLLYTLQEQEMKDQLLRTRQTYNHTLNFIYGFVTISFFIVLAAAFWGIRGLTRNLNRVTTVMTNVATHYGSKFPRVEVTSKDEIADIAIAYNKMAKEIEKQVIQEKALIEKAEQNSWLKSKVAEITSIYTSVEDFHTLATLFINKITPTVSGQYGVLYLLQGSNGHERLENMASYATLHDQIPKKSFQLGEGLIGQCAIEKRPMFLTQIPDNYVKISSGSGVGIPKNIYILPAEYEGKVLAVLEVASFEPFSSLQQDLLIEVMNHIGITINSIANRMQVKKLLQDSQTLTEELQSQSEELQLQQEELRTINEELETQYKSSEQKKEELEKISIMLEEKAQELALTSQYKTEFLANMSHELRTPLNSMLILAQMLMEKKNENLSQKQMEYIQTIYSSGNDLLHLINEVLDLAKVEAGKIEVIPAAVELESIRSFVTGYFTPLSRQKELKFHLSIDDQLPDTIFTDEHRLNQVLRNLLSNAYKFTEKGSIWLIIQSADKKKPITRDLIEPMISFTVVDTGIGIPNEKQQLIFEAFIQADGTTSRKYGGTGLGLSISREISYLLGGFMEVRSEEGVGSSFTLYLPFKHGAENETVPDGVLEVAAADELGENSLPFSSLISYEEDEYVDANQPELTLITGKKILIVDDDMRNIFALSAALEEYAIKVIFAENGKEGIDLLLENPEIDLIMMDIMMPVMDGFEAMRRIRSIPQFEDLPIIALTAKAMKHNREQCIEAGASDYISKPIDLDQLYSLIQVWLYR